MSKTSSLFAVIQLAGKQFLVEEEMSLIVPRLSGKEGEKFVIPDVLLVKSDTVCSVGTPTVTGASVSALLAKQQKAKKIRVATYKAKSRHRRVLGHRQPESVITIEKISLSKQ
ncbi:MAG: 50S ribosomal protein L21 [Candidatus Pacebacteria bacterium RIFCSPHIGHO2_01_FULL_46_16]|nr:MAG: 50S ribosomal protein L21 [Candidatus Pacebacteria bacterium RIFCSPHIGHO2_01_FULL_46_16]OGJ20076.1 MAG: 50S ribosomal protein L21 [Candidatus Pacebacteria bacterium RIFCSPHIGHO2_02_FULL_46_9]